MKYLIIIAILALIIGFSIQQVYSEEYRFKCDSVEKTLMCMIVEVYKQNLVIIEKQDWTNCVLLNKDNHTYDSPNGGSSLILSQTSEDLINICGEMP